MVISIFSVEHICNNTCSNRFNNISDVLVSNISVAYCNTILILSFIINVLNVKSNLLMDYLLSISNTKSVVYSFVIII